MGQSGSGKTTLLRAIAGLEPFRPGTDRRRRRDARERTGAGARRAGRSAARSAWCFSSIVSSSICRRSTTSAWRRCTRTAWPASDAERRARELLRGFGVEHRAARAAAKPVRRRGAARRDRAGARGRPAGAADGRADGVARSRAARGARRADAQPHRRRAHAGVATHDEEFARAWATRLLRVEDGRLGQTDTVRSAFRRPIRLSRIQI